MALVPGKKALMSGLVIAAIFAFAYNKIPALRRILGAAA